MSGAQLLLALGGTGVLGAAPSPSDGGEFTPATVSPGLPGFFAMFVLAAAVVLLAVDMTRRTRRVQAKARVQERMEAERRADADGADRDGADEDGADRDGADEDGTVQGGADQSGAGGGPEPGHDAGPQPDGRGTDEGSAEDDSSGDTAR